MPPMIKSRRRSLALAILAGLATSPSAFAESPAILEDTVLEDTVVEDAIVLSEVDSLQGQVQLVAADDPLPPAPIADPAEAITSPADLPAEPMPATIDASEIAVAAPATSCNCCTTPSCTKKQKAAATAAMKGAFKGLFYANDFSYLNDRCYDGPAFIGDCLKGMMCDSLDVGGEIRLRYHDENNFRGLGLTGNDDTFLLTRYRIFANWRINHLFRVYGEYLYADSGGENFTPRPIEENRSEIQNLFLDTQLTESLMLRLGRQELLFGDQRLVSPLDWANTRRSFQGARGTYTGDDWTVDGFYVNPLNRNPGNVNKTDNANRDIGFFGVYATQSETPVGTVDAYYLGIKNDAIDFDFHTLGSRVSGQSEGGTLYAMEGGYQFGSNQPNFGKHDAGFLTGGLGRQLNFCTAYGAWKPTVWLWYDWASGGDEYPGARGDDGFDHLYPLAHKYLGLMDLYGRRNINDANAQFITPLGDRFKFMLWYHYFFLDQKTTPYGVTLAPFNSAPNGQAGDRELGHEIDLVLTAGINPRTSVQIGYSHFNAGKYYKTTQGVPTSADADFFWTQFQWRF